MLTVPAIFGHLYSVKLTGLYILSDKKIQAGCSNIICLGTKKLIKYFLLRLKILHKKTFNTQKKKYNTACFASKDRTYSIEIKI